MVDAVLLFNCRLHYSAVFTIPAKEHIVFEAAQTLASLESLFLDYETAVLTACSITGIISATGL